MKLALKRVFAVALATVVWTLRDLWEVFWDYFFEGLLHLVLGILGLSPLGWIFALATNGHFAFKRRKMITEDTRFSFRRKRS